MFRNAKVGDRVWDFSKGWGTIVQICNDNYPITVQFEVGEIGAFTFEGKCSYSDLYPRLFWNEIKFEIPEKPLDIKEFLKRNLKPKKFVKDEENYFFYWNVNSERIRSMYITCGESIQPYFCEDNMDMIIETLNEHKVSLRQLKQAFKELGWI